ncbi:response regulator [Polaromonas aquatica]|uniref:response regulator n=1 Tax=Polaromonas aquatica TaxID=332657 RepID=UPI003D657B3F
MKITFVDDSPLMRQTIGQVLAQGFPDAKITSFETLGAAMAFAREEEQDHWLIDLGLPDGSGIDLIRQVRETFPLTHILVITVFADADNIVNSIQAGANGYLLKEDMQRAQSLASSIEAIRQGGTPLSPLIASRLLARMQIPGLQTLAKSEPLPTSSPSAPPDTPAHGLAPREVELLLLLARGYTYQEAAKLMAVELGTVQTYVKRIYTKLAVNSRTQAIFEARALGISL